ncbi:hypothetical protein [Planktotalea arctica]|uniref:hypothetical protein n=1 Tax=Planktotalea arctica TaxID=1481893 RepID=UPI003218F04E
MSQAEALQTILGLLAVGGIGGVWFRLGSITGRMIGVDRRLDAHEQRIQKLENKNA